MNRLKAFVRRTIFAHATEMAFPKKRRTVQSTRSAFHDATRAREAGWWKDLTRTEPMLAMAHRYRTDIADAIAAYGDAYGEPYVHRERYREDGPDVTAQQILAALGRQRAWTMDDYRGDHEAPARALLGLRFAVEWYATELAAEHAPDVRPAFHYIERGSAWQEPAMAPVAQAAQ